MAWRTGFFSDNAQRRYPFVSTPAIEGEAGSDQVPDSLLLDCGFTLCAYSGYEPGEHKVWLTGLSWTETHATLTFSTDTPGFAGTSIVFTFSRTGDEIQQQFAECTGTSDDENNVCEGQLLWYGYATVSDLAAAIAWAESSPKVLEADQHQIEPALIANLDQTYVRSVSLANGQRVQTTDAVEAERPVLTHTTCIQGPLRFKEGYNTQISYTSAANGLVISARVGAGAGEPCGEVPQTVGETSPDGGELLSGGPRCTEVIKSIAGIGGPIVRLRGKNGIRVRRDTEDESRLIVTVIDGPAPVAEVEEEEP